MLGLYAEALRVPFQAKRRRRRHEAQQRGRRDDGWTGEIPFAAKPHAILPVSIERRNRALTGAERVGSLTEARTAPRPADLTADGTEDLGNGFAAKPRIFRDNGRRARFSDWYMYS